MKNQLPSGLYEVLERAGISTPKQIIILSVWDIQKATKLSIKDICLIKNIVARQKSPTIFSGVDLQKCNKVSSGCSSIDNLLKGGFRKGTISEIYGESGSGKTQIAIQCAAYNPRGTLYINTEGLFPVKRYNQICNSTSSQNTECGKNVFIEHLTESEDLLLCIRVRLEKLLNQTEISLIIIDSVAAPFRCENQNYIERADELKDLAMLLYNVAQKYKLAVICINQVTASLNTNSVLPTLGLVWANMVTYRFRVKKTDTICKSTNIRELFIVFAPDLAHKETLFLVTHNGIENVP